MKNKKFITCLLLISVIAFGYYQYLVKEANKIFPINSQEVLAIQVQEHNPGKYSTQLIGSLKNKQSNFIKEMNTLQPVWDGNKIQSTTTWLHDYRILYHVTIHYHYELSRLRPASTTHIYYADNGVIIADCGGYRKYQTDSENYDEFLLLLEEYAEECFISAY